MQASTKKRFHIHVLVKIVILISSIISAFGIPLVWSSLVLFVMVLCIFFALGHGRTAIKYILFYFVLTILLYMNRLFHWNGILFSEFYFFMIWKMVPLFIALHMLMKTPPGEIVAALNKIRLPNTVTLMVVVAFRFAPTITTEIRAAHDAMKLRGLRNLTYFFKNSAKYMEYSMVPLMLRSLNVADELSISAITRGAEAPVKKHCYYQNKLTVFDGIILLTFIATTITLLIYAGASV